jgi:toxin ParE1/3/4
VSAEPEAFEVVLARDAESDIAAIWRYIAENDSIVNADRVLSGLEETCVSLSHLPSRGNVPKELRSSGIEAYREVHLGPYRIIYRITGRRVTVYCVADGRRDMRPLLERRLAR